MSLLQAERQILSVSDLTREIRVGMETLFPNVWVEGEISQLKIAASGHCYFTLKDATAQLRAILFRGRLPWAQRYLKEGMAVLARGQITVYEARGEYQLTVHFLEPKGEGARRAAFDALKEKLQKEGVFDADRKRPIPRFPARLILMTSPDGAVLHDMLAVLGGLPVALRIVPVLVQGEAAAGQIAEALGGLRRSDADLVILARGGGAPEELWTFNEEAVVRAIARCRIPVLSAIGHETDVTLADFVADLRAPTPSLAAEIVSRNVREMLERFSGTTRALHEQIHARVGRQRDRLERLQNRLAPWNPTRRLQGERERLARLLRDLTRTTSDGVSTRRQRLMIVITRLDLINPLHVLSRGFSLTRRLPDLTLVHDARQVKPDDRLEITLHHGRLRCTVDEAE
jgi:exodeoxyribonuclease VII large subunit